MPVWDLEYDGPDLVPGRPIVAVPTTAGTGSEAHSFGVITNEAAGRKGYIGHPSLLPKATILDPGLTIGLPPAVTAATGVDAMTHSLESLLSAKKTIPKAPHRAGQFIAVRDSRNRRVPGLYVRNCRYYGQLWVDGGNGKKTARRFPLLNDSGTPAANLGEAKQAFEIKRHERREGALPTGGFKGPYFAG